MTNESETLLVRSFDSLEAAAAGVNALVGAGIPHGAIELRVIAEEREHRGMHLVMVRAEDESQRRKLDSLLQREGGRAVQELAEAAAR